MQIEMSEAKIRFPDDTGELPDEMVELGRQITKLSPAVQAELRESYGRMVDCIRRRRRILSLVQEALAQLRLDIKYLMFDLEATRRERDQLRKQLDELN